MAEFSHNKGIENANLSSEMRKSFLDYAMSVIVSRALPDVRDGLKPVHRRILYGMQELGVTPDKPHKKSARIVGDVMGKYHPHGDSAIYESMVRMAQDFSYRYELVDGHGNFGSVDGDSAAAMRYTEARMSKIALEMLRDINKDTIDYVENYDGSESEPEILPARFPNLLVNGASGIAVGMATNIPPHNLSETINAVKVLMDNPEATTEDLMKALPGPDFPTGGILLGKSGIKKAYDTGRGKITLRARADIEEMPGDRERIIVSELPYVVNKAKLVEKIAELAREKEIEGITAIRDESNRTGMRIVINVRRDASAGVILNNLYKMTQMQTSFGFNMLAIVDGVPKTLSLKDILVEYLKHQENVITRRTIYDKKKAENRAHILEGLRIALDHIDAIITLIRNSQETSEAKTELIDRYDLSDRQAQAILDMRLSRLTGLERDKIESEYNQLIENIEKWSEILGSTELINEIIWEEMNEISEKYGDERRTELRIGEALTLDDEDLIEESNVVIALTSGGYIKRMEETEFKSQNRGGRGVKGMSMQDDDFVSRMVTTSTHDVLLFITNAGKIYRKKAYEIPEYGRTAKGLPVVNLLDMEPDEHVQAIIRVDEKVDSDEFIFFVTKNGTVKRTNTDQFKNIRTSGIIAIDLREGDEMSQAFLTHGNDVILIGTRKGYAVTFKEEDIRSMGRTASGVRGVRLREDDEVVGSGILTPDSEVMVITSNGYGKRTAADEYAIRGRGGKGVKTVNLTKKNGELVAVLIVGNDDEVMIMSSKGIMIRFATENVSTTSRVTQGVRLIKLEEEDFVTAAEKMEKDDEENDSEQNNSESENTNQDEQE